MFESVLSGMSKIRPDQKDYAKTLTKSQASKKSSPYAQGKSLDLGDTSASSQEAINQLLDQIPGVSISTTDSSGFNFPPMDFSGFPPPQQQQQQQQTSPLASFGQSYTQQQGGQQGPPELQSPTPPADQSSGGGGDTQLLGSGTGAPSSGGINDQWGQLSQPFNQPPSQSSPDTSDVAPADTSVNPGMGGVTGAGAAAQDYGSALANSASFTPYNFGSGNASLNGTYGGGPSGIQPWQTQTGQQMAAQFGVPFYANGQQQAAAMGVPYYSNTQQMAQAMGVPYYNNLSQAYPGLTNSSTNFFDSMGMFA